MRDSLSRYTNLALMMSDQCPWTVRIRTGTVEEVIGGPVYSHVESAKSRIIDIRRRLAKDYDLGLRKIPHSALNEVLLNAVSHRSYCSPEPITVDVRAESVTISSPGGPVRTGNSFHDRTRNPNLAALLRSSGMKDPKVRGIDGVIWTYKTC